MFTQAILRVPDRNFVNGITSSNLGLPHYETALSQHLAYQKALEECGLKTQILPSDPHFPDSCFIEDVALCTPKCAIITRPGALERRKETEGIDLVLKEFYEEIEYIQAPGTLEAGDVMMVENHYFIGLSKRTNPEGANQFIQILNQYDMTGSVVELSQVLHLKTGVSYLENDYMLATGEFLDKVEFQSFHLIEVPGEEAYAANSVWVNGKVLIPEGFPHTREKIEKAGYATIPVPVSEFQKLDGGLSCLSLRF